MDVREKLEVIAHLGDHISYKEDIGICYDSTLAKVIEDAYMTLKNGVTVQELDGCEHCRTASYTENPFTVITQMGREVKTQFNFCPNCGRRLPQPPKGE